MAGTASDRVQDPDRETDQTLHSQLLMNTSELRDRHRLLGDGIRSLDHHAQLQWLTDEANALVTLGLTKLLEAARAYGFAWGDIAAVVGVSVPALRKWRHGGNASPANLQALARFVASCKMLRSMLSPTQEVAAWLQLPLAPHHLTRLDLYVDGHLNELFDLAAERMATTDVLAKVRPAWRDELDDFKVDIASDGLPAIVRRTR